MTVPAIDTTLYADIDRDEQNETTRRIGPLIGLSEDATAGDILDRLAYLQATPQERARMNADEARELAERERKARAELRQFKARLERFRRAVGARTTEEAFARMAAVVHNVRALEQQNAELEQQLAETTRAIEDGRRAQLEAQGIESRQLNPALIEFYRSKPVAELETFLGAAPECVPRPHRQPKTVTGDGQSAASGKGGANAAGDLTWNDKTYAELKPAQCAELHRENPDLYELMRNAWKQSRGGRWLAT